MKKKIFASIALLALLTACDDHYDDQFNINPGITDVKDIAMTLETSDYGSISKLTANQELALSKDPEGKTFVKALEAVGTNHYFTEEAPAEDYRLSEVQIPQCRCRLQVCGDLQAFQPVGLYGRFQGTVHL